MTPDYEGFPVPLIEFAQYKTIGGFSKKTVDEYMLDLRMFCRYTVQKRKKGALDDETLAATDISSIDWSFFDSIKEFEIYDFIVYSANSRKNGNATKSRKLSAIKSFYKYANVRVKKTENNPAANIESPKQKKSLPKHLSEDECIDLLSTVQGDAESKTVLRDYCILTLFLNCGMRLSELCGISLSDIDRDMTSLRVVGKGSKERVIYLNSACRDVLGKYIPERLADARVKKGETALFVSNRGQRISSKTVQWMVKKYLDGAGLENKHYSTHKLRHTAATLMYRSGEVDIRVLKDILGHEQLNTTQIYTHVSDENMASAMEKNPLANIKIRGKKGEDNDNS